MIVRLTLVNQDPGADSAALRDRLASLPLVLVDSAHGPDEPGAWAWSLVHVQHTAGDASVLLRAIDQLGPVLVEVVEP